MFMDKKLIAEIVRTCKKRAIAKRFHKKFPEKEMLIVAPVGVEMLEAALIALSENKERQTSEAYAYLKRLFLICAPQCEPLPDLLGLSTQIDNLIAGYRIQLSLMPDPALDEIATDMSLPQPRPMIMQAPQTAPHTNPDTTPPPASDNQPR